MNRLHLHRFAVSNFFLIIIIIAVYCLWALGRPIAAIAPVQAQLVPAKPLVSNQLDWPATGQAAIGMTPSGVLATHGDQTPVPTASVAKVFTALMVLKKRPLAADQTGPTITITEADVQSYRDYVAGDGSVIPIEVGDKLTQYQMLQAILLPSANNIADTLAIWAFGSLENYANFANSYIRQLGLTNTYIGKDASGYDASTVSTARDLVLLGEAAIQEPVIADIVAQPTAVLPSVGLVENRNFLLGPEGLSGIKTGTTFEAGGVFLGSKSVTVDGKKFTLVSAIMGAATKYDAIVDSLPLIKSAQANFTQTPVVAKGTVVGTYTTPWGSSATAATTKDLSALAWKGSTVPTSIMLDPVKANSQAGQAAGSLQIPRSPVSMAQSTPVALTNSFAQPSFWWRLSHPF